MGVMIPNKVARFFMAHGVANVTLCYAEQWVLFSGSRGRSPVWVWCEAPRSW